MQRRRLLFSIHDVAPAFERQIDSLLDLAGHHVGKRLAMLVVPNHWASEPLRAGSAFAGRLRRWSDAGIEMFLHGWSHRDDSVHRSAADQLRARHATAGEGEFLGLDRAEAARRIGMGRALLEDILGRPLAGFVAPAWLYGPGAREALRDSGLALAEDHFKVWSLADDRRLLAGPVITWASRSEARIRSSLLAAAAARTLPMPPTVRVAVHPGDTGVPRLLHSIDRTLSALGKSRTPAAYSDLLPPEAAGT